MGKLRVTTYPDKDYVLVNDFKSPPYMAYEITDAEGNKNFVRVLTGGNDESHRPPHPATIKPTPGQIRKIKNMLDETLAKPLKHGEFMSEGWMEKLVRSVGIFHNHTMEVASGMLERWLRHSTWKELIEQIRQKQKDASEKVTTKAKLAEEKAKAPSSSKKAVQKRRAPKKDETPDDSSSDETPDDTSSDASLFTPIKVLHRRAPKKGETPDDTSSDETPDDTSSDASLFTPIKVLNRRAPKKGETPDDTSSDESLFTPIRVERKIERLQSEVRELRIVLRRVDDE